MEKGELETRDGSDCLVMVESNSSHSPTASRTETDDDNSISSVISAKSNILDTLFDDDKEFNLDKPTDYSLQGQAITVKDVVVKEIVVIEDNGTSEEIKKVSESTEKSSTVIAEASQAEAIPETPLVSDKIMEPAWISSFQDDYALQEEDSALLVTYLSKTELKEC